MLKSVAESPACAGCTRVYLIFIHLFADFNQGGDGDDGDDGDVFDSEMKFVSDLVSACVTNVRE
jgi:hypothetical protein